MLTCSGTGGLPCYGCYGFAWVLVTVRFAAYSGMKHGFLQCDLRQNAEQESMSRMYEKRRGCALKQPRRRSYVFVSVLFHYLVVFRKYHCRLVSLGLLKVHKRVSDDYHRVAHLTFPCRRAVEANATASAFAFMMYVSKRSPLLLFTICTFSPAIRSAASIRSSSMVMLPI